MAQTNLVQIFLPLVGGADDTLGDLKRELGERFGGLTAYNRAPAEGIWRDEETTEKDEIVIVEVMTESVDRDFWRDLRKRLEQRLGQKEILLRAQAVERL